MQVLILLAVLAVPTAVPTPSPSPTPAPVATTAPAPVVVSGAGNFWARACVLDLIDVEVPGKLTMATNQEHIRLTEPQIFHQVLCFDVAGPMTRGDALLAVKKALAEGIYLTYGGYDSTANDVAWPPSRILKAWGYYKAP